MSPFIYKLNKASRPAATERLAASNNRPKQTPYGTRRH